MSKREWFRGVAFGFFFNALVVAVATIVTAAWGRNVGFAIAAGFSVAGILSSACAIGFDEPDLELLEHGQDADDSSGGIGDIRSVEIGMRGGSHSFALSVSGRGEIWLSYIQQGPAGSQVQGSSHLSRVDQLNATAVLLESLQGVSLNDAAAFRSARQEITRELANSK